MKCSNNVDYSVVRYVYEKIQDNPQLLVVQIVRAVTTLLTTHNYVGCRAGDLTCPAIVADKWQRGVYKNNTAQQDDDINCCGDGFLKKLKIVTI